MVTHGDWRSWERLGLGGLQQLTKTNKHKTKFFSKRPGIDTCILQCIFASRNPRLRAVVHTHRVYGHGIQLSHLPNFLLKSTWRNTLHWHVPSNSGFLPCLFIHVHVFNFKCCKKICNNMWNSKGQQKQLVISNMELHPLAPLQCSAAIPRHQRFPVPGSGLIYLHYVAMGEFFQRWNCWVGSFYSATWQDTASRNHYSWSLEDLAPGSCLNDAKHLNWRYLKKWRRKHCNILPTTLNKFIFQSAGYKQTI